MHGKIIQLINIRDLNGKPVGEEDYVTEDYFYDGFSGWIADYVDEIIDNETRFSVFNNFQLGLKSEFPEYIICTKDTITFKEGFKEAYAESRISLLEKALAAEPKECEHPIDAFYRTKYLTRAILSDPFGTYIYQEGWGLMPESDYLVSVAAGTYCLGSVIDYHY